MHFVVWGRDLGTQRRNIEMDEWSVERQVT